MLFQHMTYVLICRDVMLGFVQSNSTVLIDSTSGQFMKGVFVFLWIKNDIGAKNADYLREPSYGNIDDRKIYAMHTFREHLPLTRVLGKANHLLTILWVKNSANIFHFDEKVLYICGNI